jgi:hypothetical protein
MLEESADRAAAAGNSEIHSRQESTVSDAFPSHGKPPFLLGVWHGLVLDFANLAFSYRLASSCADFHSKNNS